MITNRRPNKNAQQQQADRLQMITKETKTKTYSNLTQIWHALLSYSPTSLYTFLNLLENYVPQQKLCFIIIFGYL